MTIAKYSLVAIVLTSALVAASIYSSSIIASPDSSHNSHTSLSSLSSFMATTVSSRSTSTSASKTSSSIEITSSSLNTLSETSKSNISNVVLLFAKNDTGFGAMSNSGVPRFYSAFNFSSSTDARQFTIAGSFISNENFDFSISYYNNSHDIVLGFNPSLDRSGNYTLKINMSLPIILNEHYLYRIGINSIRGAWLATTSDFEMTSNQFTDLAYSAVVYTKY